MDNLKDFLFASVLIDDKESKLEINIKELLEKEPFMKLLQDNAVKSGAKENKN